MLDTYASSSIWEYNRVDYVFDKIKITLFYFMTNKGIGIANLQSQEKGNGNANNFFKILFDISKKLSVNVFVRPEPFDENALSLNEEELKKWYKRLGFNFITIGKWENCYMAYRP